MLTSLRLFSRAPCTRIRSWLSAGCSAGDCVCVLVAMLIVSPSVGRGPPSRSPVGVAWLDLTSFEQYVWFSLVGAVAATVRCLPRRRCRPGGGASRRGGFRCGREEPPRPEAEPGAEPVPVHRPPYLVGG